MAKRRNNLTNDTPKFFVGLDIGTTKIATVVGYMAMDGKIEVIGHGKSDSNGVQHGLVYNLSKTINGIKASVELASHQSGQPISDVFVGIAGRHIKNTEFRHRILRRNGTEELIHQDEIDEMIKTIKETPNQTGETVIDVIPQKFYIDGNYDREIIDPVGELGIKLEGVFQIITGNEHEINKVLRCVEDAELNPADLILEPLASGLVSLTQEEKQAGVVLVDIGGGTTDIAIYLEGNPVYTQVIPIGGHVITSDIASVCQIPEEIAEKLKINHGTCLVEKSNKNNFITIPKLGQTDPVQISEEYLAQIIYARIIRDILNPVKVIIENSGYESNIMSVVITGGGAYLKHLKELAQFTFRKPTRIGSPEFGFLSVPAELRHPMYSTGLGLLKFGVTNNFDYTDDVEETPKKTRVTKKTDSSKNENSMKKVKLFFKNMLDGFIEKTE